MSISDHMPISVRIALSEMVALSILMFISAIIRRLGINSILNPGVKIYHDCVIGQGCIIHAGSVIGSDGFGFAPQSENEYMKIPQLGNVVLEDYVEIGC